MSTRSQEGLCQMVKRAFSDHIGHMDDNELMAVAHHWTSKMDSEQLTKLLKNMTLIKLHVNHCLSPKCVTLSRMLNLQEGILKERANEPAHLLN